VSITMYAVCYECARIQPYPARFARDEECAPFTCENCGRQTLDIGWDAAEADDRSALYAAPRVAV
jgi:hypothetical protein